MARHVGRARVAPPSRPEGYSGRHRPGAEPDEPESYDAFWGSAREKRRPRRTGPGRRRRLRPSLPLWQELPLLLLLAFSLALIIRTFCLQAFFIPTGSMENTLQVSDRVLVNKMVYDFREPRRGEVIVFRGTDSWAPERTVEPSDTFAAKAGRFVGGLVGLAEPNEKDFVKRVIGTPGDSVMCCDDRGRIVVNGRSVTEPYIFENTPLSEREFGPIVVPKGRLFVLGDHRGLSQDSRAYLSDRWKGTIPIGQVIGRAFLKVWPASRWDTVPDGATRGRPSAAAGSGPDSLQWPMPAIGPAVVAVSVPLRRRRPRRLRW